MGSIIRSVGVHCPERILTNKDLVEILKITSPEKGTSEEWIIQRTGIKERRIASPDETNQTMAVKATKSCLERILSLGDFIPRIEHIIVATNTNQRLFPSTAMYVQGEINRIMPGVIADGSAGYDPFAGCGGINLAFQQADALIRARFYRTILVLGTEHLSSVTDYSDRSTCILFGDGASAHLVTATTWKEKLRELWGLRPNRYGFIGHYTKGTPEGGKFITCEEDQEKVAFYDAVRAVEEETAPRRTRGRVLKMNGREVFRYVVSEMKELIDNFETNKKLNPHGISFSQVRWVIPHQVNNRIIDAINDRFPDFRERCQITLPEFGNTSTASQGLPLSRALERANVKDYVLMVGFGSGLILGANLYRVSPTTYRMAA